MALTRGTFVAGLLDAVPETKNIVKEHADDFDGDVLLHLLVADLRRFCLDAWQSNSSDALARCLNYLDLALRTGDDQVQNAIAVSFVEDMGLGREQVRPFLDVWPDALAAEAEQWRT